MYRCITHNSLIQCRYFSILKYTLSDNKLKLLFTRTTFIHVREVAYQEGVREGEGGSLQSEISTIPALPNVMCQWSSL